MKAISCELSICSASLAPLHGLFHRSNILTTTLFYLFGCSQGWRSSNSLQQVPSAQNSSATAMQTLKRLPTPLSTLSSKMTSGISTMLPTPLHIQLSSLDEGPDAHSDRGLKPNPCVQQKSCGGNQIFFAYTHRSFFPEHPMCIVMGGCLHIQEFTTARKPGEEITGERGQEPDGEEGLTESPGLQAQ